jgi:hypothetical protein
MTTPFPQHRRGPIGTDARGGVMALLVFAASCQSRTDDDGPRFTGVARNTFVKEYSCPVERVSARLRDDLDVYALYSGPLEPPPKEIADDPGRLAQWKKDHGRPECKKDPGWLEGTTYFCSARAVQVSGCDHEGYYVCMGGAHAAGQPPGAVSDTCTPSQYPPK